MNAFLTLAYLFFIGSLLGWGIEVIFRRFFAKENVEKKWINPGFLTGPYLPLYGFGLCFLFLLALTEPYIPIASDVWRKLILFLLMAVAMTGVEYVAGVIFIRGMNVELWNYKNEWGNIQGIICPKFSAYWAILGAVYYFLVHPRIENALEWLSRNLAFSFVIGFFFGVFMLDFANATRIVVKIRAFARENEIVVRYEELKARIRQGREELRGKKAFLFSMHGSRPLGDYLRGYLDKYKAEIEEQLEKSKAELEKRLPKR